MSSIKDFLLDVNEVETREVALKRFPTPFVIRSISEEENEVLKKAATIRYKSKTGQRTSDFDPHKYNSALVTSSIVTPDLHNAELQKHYGTDGSASETIKKMMRPGEYAELQMAIQELNGFDLNEMEDLKEEAKKD